MLYQYFEPKTQGLLYEILKEIEIRNMEISYDKSPPETPDIPTFKATGQFLVAGSVSIRLTYKRSKTNWSFEADVKEEDAFTAPITLWDITRSIFGNESSFVKDLPEFLANAEILGPNSTKPYLSLRVGKNGDDGVQLLLTAGIGSIKATFIQFHQLPNNEGDTTKPSPIRYFQLICELPKIPSQLPLFGKFTPPFDQLGFLWANKALDAEDLSTIQKIQNPNQAVAGQASAEKDPKKPGMKEGFHFAVLSATVVVLDYLIGKPRSQPRGQAQVQAVSDTSTSVPEVAPAAQDLANGPVDEKSPKVPLKKSQGPLSISDIQLHYKEKSLAIKMDAVFAVGPLMFALLGFELSLAFEGKVNIRNIQVTDVHLGIDGLAASFDKPPLKIEGGLIRKPGDDVMYAGGITIGFVPWLFQAAGFYGRMKNPDFTSALVYAILRGPLITLEFATISGITGGFGYNVGINIPRVEDVYRFPFLAPPATTDIVDTLNALIKPPADGSPQWFYPQEGGMWLAAGLTVSAFEMLDITAVLVAQWSPQIQFNILGLAVADIPNAKSPKLAHVELGFKASIDVTAGLFSVEAQLSPNSYILDRNCHLSGGFALYYWFKNTQSGREGDWVFTIGGYHSAYQVPANYPRPPRLAISWALGSALAIKGEAYFAVTPKACMAGLHINAVLTLGPLRAWFDAYADFLVNYAPFHFVAVGHVGVGVSYNMDVWFVHIHIGVEIGATLHLSDPPIAGTVSVDFWVSGFEIAFGDASQQNHDTQIPLISFFDLALGSGAPGSSGTESPKPHVYTCLGGLISSDTNPDVPKNAPWEVRPGPFAFGINALFAIETAIVNGVKMPAAPEVTEPIYAKPTHLPSALKSELNIAITGPKGEVVNGWRLKPIVKSVPRALWGQYDSRTDPMSRPDGNNSISDLLAGDNACVRLAMGVEIQAPEPHIPMKSDNEERLLPFDAEAAMVETFFTDPNAKEIQPPPPEPPKLWPLFPLQTPQSLAWTPEKPKPPPDDQNPELGQWGAAKDAWSVANPKTMVNALTKLMDWKKPTNSAVPIYLAEHMHELYLEAPHFCISAAA